MEDKLIKHDGDDKEWHESAYPMNKSDTEWYVSCTLHYRAIKDTLFNNTKNYYIMEKVDKSGVSHFFIRRSYSSKVDNFEYPTLDSAKAVIVLLVD